MSDTVIKEEVQTATIYEAESANSSNEVDLNKKSRWKKFLEVIWDGPQDPEERKYVRKLDLFLLTWGCYGYFIKVLDSSNFSNAYVSGMKEAINIKGDDYNYALSLYQAGYVVGVIPSQLLILKVKPSIWFPVMDLIWSVLTFCTAVTKNTNQLFAIRFLIGFFESPFYVGALTLFSSWYTEKELAKRACILYSASNISSMFSGYLQSGVYTNLNGVHNRAGWQWLFIVCGSITLPLTFFGFIAIPDSPNKPSKMAFWLKDKDLQIAKQRFSKRRVGFTKLELKDIKNMIFDWPFYFIVWSYTSYMIFTNATGYFVLYIDSLNRYSVSQVNNIPTAAQGIALIGNLILGWLADFKGRSLVLYIALVFNLISTIFLLITPSEGCIWFGYLISGISWVYGPVLISWSQEILKKREFESKLTLGIAQASAIANLIWATIVLWSTSREYPLYKAAWWVTLGLTIVQFPVQYIMSYLVKRENREELLFNEKQSDSAPEDNVLTA